MAKEVDVNGFWTVRRNPLSKVGVFDYLSQTISDSLEPGKIVKVYRPAETLRNAAAAWNNAPIILEHEMLGEGFTKVDDRPVAGTVSNVEFDEEDGVLYGDITIWSENLKDAITNGTKEISLGYRCRYGKQSGVYKGQAYDFTQNDMTPNHVAIVPAGRCGSDVRVFDAKDSKCTMDALDVNPTNFEAQDTDSEKILNKNQESQTIDNEETNLRKGNDMVDKREFIREIMAIAAKPDSDFEGGEKEKIETIAKKLEESEYSKSERGTANDEDADKEDKKTEDKCGKDEDADKEEKKSEDSLDPAEVMGFLRAIVERLDAVLNKKAVVDEDDKSDDDKKDSEDEEEEKEDDKKKSAEDSAVFVFGNKTAQDAANDAALQAYLND